MSMYNNKKFPPNLLLERQTSTKQYSLKFWITSQVYYLCSTAIFRLMDLDCREARSLVAILFVTKNEISSYSISIGFVSTKNI